MKYFPSENVSEDFVLVLLYRKFLSYKAKKIICPAEREVNFPRRWTIRKRFAERWPKPFSCLLFCSKFTFTFLRIPNSEFRTLNFRNPNSLFLRIPNSEIRLPFHCQRNPLFGNVYGKNLYLDYVAYLEYL